MGETAATTKSTARSDVLRLLGGLSSPNKALSLEAQRELKGRLGELEDLVVSKEIGRYDGSQLGKLVLLGSAAIPAIVSMMVKLGPNERERTRFLIEALEEIAAPAPELLRPYQKELHGIIMKFDVKSHTFYGDTATSFGNCLGGIGESADELIATSINAHIQELNKERDPYKESNLRLVTLVRAAEVCGGPKSKEAIRGLRFNTKGAGMALRVLFRFGETEVMKDLTSKVILEKASGALLQTLRDLMILPEQKAEPFATEGKDQLKKLAENTSLHGDIRGTALSVLFRFFYSEALEMGVKLSSTKPRSEGGWNLLIHLVRAAFASDGLQEEMQVREGGYRLFSPGHGHHDDSVSGAMGGQIRVKAQVVYRGDGTKLGEQHVAIARNVVSHGATEAALLLWGMLGEGVSLSIKDPLCVDMITGSSDSSEVYYRPVSLLDTPKEVISELAKIACQFAGNDKLKWDSFWSLNVCGHAADYGAIYAIRFLLRVRAGKQLAKLAANDKLPNVQSCALQLSGCMAGELKEQYGAALEAGNRNALYGLVQAARETPEAASIIRSHGRDVMLYVTSIASPASSVRDPFGELACIAPAFAAELHQDYLRGASGVSMDVVVGKDDKKLNAVEGFRKMQKSIPSDH